MKKAAVGKAAKNEEHGYTMPEEGAVTPEQNASAAPSESAARAGDDGAEGLEHKWRAIQAALFNRFGQSMYDSWFKQLNFISIGDGRAVHSAPNDFVRNWILQNHEDMLLDLWRTQTPEVRRVEILLSNRPRAVRADLAVRNDNNPSESGKNPEPANGTGARGTEAKAEAKTPEAVKTPSIIRPVGDEAVGAPLDRRLTFDNFVVGKSNELAYAAARRVAESSSVTFNPLFFYSSVGLGKTHLMHAIGWEIRRRQPERKVVYLSAEKFMFEFVAALRDKTTMDFKQAFRSVDVLMVDDVHFIGRKESTQEEFFHTFNALVEHNRQIIISADRSPADLDGVDERIRSRLGWGLVADIQSTDYELRLGILQAKAEQISRSNPDLQVPSEVLDMLAARITSNTRELEGALNRVIAHATLVGRPINPDMAKDVLSDLLRAQARRISVDDIQRAVAEFYNIRVTDMLSARRSRPIVVPRQIAMYLAKQLTTRSLPEIGRRFGNRDHTTVIHSIRKIEGLVGKDPTLADEVEKLRRRLEG